MSTPHNRIQSRLMHTLKETTWPHFRRTHPKTSDRPRLNLETVSNDRMNRYGCQMPKFTSCLSQSSANGKELLALYTVCILAHWKGCVYWHWGLHSEARHRIDKVPSVRLGPSFSERQGTAGKSAVKNGKVGEERLHVREKCH